MGKSCVNLRFQIKKTLKSKEKFNESKHASTSADGIYSFSTSKTYAKHCQKFADFVIQKAGTSKINLSTTYKYVSEFMKNEIDSGKSPYTLKTERSALAKLYGVSGRDICTLPERSRSEIKRSRNQYVTSEKTGKTIKNQSVGSGHFSEKNHSELVEFCKSTGLRRSELSSLRGNQLYFDAGKPFIKLDGYQCKGGRERIVPVIGNFSNAITLCEKAGSGKVFERIPQAMDVHSYRSKYATSLYNQEARQFDAIPKNERYYCRKELAGTCYDKRAMQIVSNALGHNRISVIAEHYLR